MCGDLDLLVTRYERGTISRRELIAGLAALCATPSAGASAAGRGAGPTMQGAAQQPAQREAIPLSGMDHIALRVSDLARSTKFYQEHLGGRIRSQSSGATFLDVGQHWVALFARGAVSTGYEATQPGVDHISFHSPKHRSLEERMGVLRAHGLNPVSPAGSSRVYFRDPDGIILQLS
jgi:metallothiol transferase